MCVVVDGVVMYVCWCGRVCCVWRGVTACGDIWHVYVRMVWRCWCCLCSYVGVVDVCVCDADIDDA